nr:hypothetical protein [Candidatus Njordarchaeum guaymaensis]
MAVVRELGGVEPSSIVERLAISLSRVGEAGRKLVAEGLVRIGRNIPDLRSRSRANAAFYLDAGKATALHDVVMNEIWKRNIELGGKSRDYSFQRSEKTWHTDGLLDNAGGKFLLDVVAGRYDSGVLERVEADMSPPCSGSRVGGCHDCCS